MGCSFKDQKCITITNFFQTILKRRPNKIWVDKGSEFYNRSMKSRLQDNDTEMHSTRNGRKSVVAKRFVRTSQNKIYKHMTAASKKWVYC